MSSNSKNIKNHQKDFHDANLRLINRSVELLKQKKNIKMNMKFLLIYISMEGEGYIMELPDMKVLLLIYLKFHLC